MFADVVIEGGGIKAIGLIGAIHEAEKRGYEWKRLAGTSAGAIIASFLAAGYTAEELKKIMLEMNYKQFIRKKGILHLPVIGQISNLLRYSGIYCGDALEEWVWRKLLAKGVRTFQDLDKPVYIIASDITSGTLLKLPDDLIQFDIEPSTFEIAKAVRMSASIPFYFQPVRLKTNDGTKNGNRYHYIVDGGILSNFPVWIFDSEFYPKWPTFGFRLVSEKTGKPNKVKGPLSLGHALINTMMDAHDMLHLKEKDFVRTIMVNTLGTKTTEFDISDEQREKLYLSGVNSAKKFFNQWNFAQYASTYRSKEIQS
ncbi:patatin-like phospholipase family protein [Tepidibacillus fermentans]|uniref:NTE family protein n=1 Tax=Tepidibacillus fermentans TaxID=1281767 RepID=A0A4R3KJS8_9BACI|nr:patatin-like phospholipase family protein [Tepidibacillus fermentans]TCS84013.1 NTE family protein [Tepidibacillus fermentans]